ncbi:uncharacterized protein LOC5501706 isoform X1 [Nematostella vectensis]|uniref:uncharacterized protein LOC5501706 isoform X1 n=1 Tax=Nematostella vectensis TaxID=45351 RepID=UPI00139059A8|nr:uncharacterized protein LOC5501706 isoform X1 [Nematostella vectensis]
MGTTMSSINLASKPPALPPAKQNNKVPKVKNTPPDYKFEHFMQRCQYIQDEKKQIQVEIRMEVLEWRKRARQGEVSVDDCRDKILGLLSRFRDVQQQQDKLIEKERFRLDAFRNSINEDTTSRIKSRLNFFCKLNRQHEALLELVRQDVQDCKNICRQYNDTQSNSKCKGFETWIKCPARPAYDYGSIGSL